MRRPVFGRAPAGDEPDRGMQALVYHYSTWRWIATRCLSAVSARAGWSRLAGLRLREIDPPALPGPQWVRLRTRLGGICGTDLAAVRLRNHPATVLQAVTSFPAVFGHECVATIDAVGEAVTGWAVGERVVVEPSLSCVPRGVDPPCRYCREGRFTLCESVAGGSLPPGMMVGYNCFTGGSWGEQFVAHQSQLFRVPEGLPDEQAVIVDPLACAVHAVLRVRPPDEARVLVIGGGFIAAAVIAALRATGFAGPIDALVRRIQAGEHALRCGASHVICAPRFLSRAERYALVARHVGARPLAGRFGNQMLLGGFDVVYDCVGTAASLEDAMKFVRAGGTVAEVGTTQIGIVDHTPLWFSEIRVVGCNGRALEDWDGRRRHTYEIVFDWLAGGRIPFEPFLPQLFPLRDYRRALATAAGLTPHRPLKVAFDFRSDRPA